MLSKLNGTIPNPISTKELDISEYPLKKLGKLYGITAIDIFKNGISKFSKDGTRGWIRKDGFIIGEGFDNCRDFLNGFAIFHRKDKSQGWMSEDGKILAEGFKKCGRFSGGIATFKDINGDGWIDETGKIIAQGKYIKAMESEHGFAKFTYGLNILGKLDLKFKNGFCPFYMPAHHKFGWLSNTGVILADYLDKTYPFDEDIKGYARFEKEEKEGYMDDRGNILDYKKLYNLAGKFEGFFKFEKNTGEIGYLDSKFKEWDRIDNRNGVLFLKKGDKWFKQSIVK